MVAIRKPRTKTKRYIMKTELKSTDLRKGNLIYGYTGIENPKYDICEVNSIVNDGLAVNFNDRKDYYMEIEYYKPIELTEEWLIKFGFVNWDYGWHIKLDEILILRLIMSNGNYYPQLEQQPELSNDECQYISLYSIQHVHQLQNLYFALTNSELTIKEQ